MAISFKSNIDLGGLALQFATLHPASAAPTSPAASEGQVYWNTGDDKLYVYNGSGWIDVSGDIRSITAGGGISVSNGSGGDATVSLSHLGLESLTAISGESAIDSIFFYDVSSSSSAYLTCDTASGIAIDGTSLKLASIPNTSLANSSITVTGGNGLTATAGATSLGGSTTVAVGEGTGIDVTADAVALKNHAGLSDDTLTMWDDTNGQLIDSPISDDGTSVTVGSSRNLVIAGNLTVQGSTTTVDSNVVNIGDAMLSLNADIAADGTPSEDAGIEVERGASANKKFYWDETLDSWRVGGELIIDTVPAVSGTTTQTRILVEKAHATDTTIQQTTVADIGTALGVGLYSVLLDPGRTNVSKTGNVYTVAHGLGTRLVQIEVVDASTYETVFVEVARPSTTTATISFAQSVTNAAYFCMISAVGNVDTTGDLTP
jgi:hypothetical protein